MGIAKNKTLTVYLIKTSKNYKEEQERQHLSPPVEWNLEHLCKHYHFSFHLNCCIDKPILTIYVYNNLESNHRSHRQRKETNLA